ncbi:hypothetical protein [Mesoterricola sediminis]|uniref:DNA primase/polymerase bifunctional N-terminal domain-containing protein n=1 Tax=Mesoterricola sediminis TaxID=2927980 RepID=A0AA48HGH7_9BACT|nr:hypothetical protein [Mesoterricola sediminis]BDU77793.1 hypothetical protein METESE_27510 [Mesoterricola sediminis]
MTTHASQFNRYSRYQWIYHALLEGGVPIAVLKAGSKKIAAPTAPQSLCRDLQHVEIALDDLGLNLGAITHNKDLPGINPNRFADLDIDDLGHGCDLSPFNFRVCRKDDPELGHYWFRVADPSQPIEASNPATHDVCTWNTVLPGSIHADGSMYELQVKEDGIWVPWDGQPFSLDLLPILDPAPYRISPKDRESALNKRNTRTRPEQKRVEVLWVTASGKPETRLKKAKFYLRGKAWKSISGMNGHGTFLAVMCNLRLYFQLPLSLAMPLVKEHYNPRCIDAHGNPAPWSDKEIEHKFDEAGKPGMFPSLGVSDPKAKAKVAAEALHSQVRTFLGTFTVPGGSCRPAELRCAFIAFRCGEDVSETAFGIAMEAACGIRTRKPGGVRAYVGIHLSEAGLGLTRSGVAIQEAA